MDRGETHIKIEIKRTTAQALRELRQGETFSYDAVITELIKKR